MEFVLLCKKGSFLFTMTLEVLFLNTDWATTSIFSSDECSVRTLHGKHTLRMRLSTLFLFPILFQFPFVVLCALMLMLENI
jgi:hypothetical protein